MQTLLQGLVIMGGLTFSLAASLLIEELIFGRIVRLAFMRPPAEQSGSRHERPVRSSVFSRRFSGPPFRPSPGQLRAESIGLSTQRGSSAGN